MSLTFPPPPKHGRAVLNPDQVREVAQHASDGLPYAEIAELYGVSIKTVSHVATGRTWKEITRIEFKTRINRITPTERGEILALAETGMKPAEIADATDRCLATIYRVIAASRAAPE